MNVIVKTRFINYAECLRSIMASIDKVGMAVAVAITAIFLGVAAAMGAAQDAGPVTSTPKPIVVEKPMEETPKVEEKMMEEPEKTVEAEEEVMMEEKEEEVMMEEPTTHVVEIPVGISVPGCEETNACYLPADITINAGDTITWDNIDSAVHTVTAGTPADAQMEVFHSDLIMPDATWDRTFDDVGSNDYFCMVHPWMVGSVTVN